jgi:lipopolysaccharide/colanic/teichoic acid biosynthesis glycosyltransferase
VEHDQFFADHIPGYWERYDVLPGITGWAQIHGCRGETPTVEVMQDRVHLDIWYVRNRSLLLDIKVLLLTPRVTFGGNAY